MKHTHTITSLKLIAVVLTIAALFPACASPPPSDSGDRSDEHPRVHHDELPTQPTFRIESDRSREGDLDYVFDQEALPVVTLEVSEYQWQNLLENYDENPQNERYIRGDFEFDKREFGGQLDRFEDIGLRVRGGAFSRARPYEEGEFRSVHWRVSFNTFIDSGRFYRQRNLIFKFLNNDPAYVREHFSYDLFNRFGVPASRTSYARLHLRMQESGQVIPLGVYLMVEPVDRSFLKTRFDGDHMGYLWKNSWGTGPADLAWPPNDIGMEDPEARLSYTYDFKTHSEERGVLFSDAREGFEEFVDNINHLEGQEFETWLGSNMDVEGLLRLYAVNVLVHMWDDYWNNGNNYYLYQDSDGIWHFLPWDYDNTLGTDWGVVPDMAERDLFAWGQADNAPLLNKVMQRPAFREQYRAYLEELLDPENELFAYDPARERIRQWQALIDEYIDPNYAATAPSGQNNHHILEDRAGGQSPYSELKLLSGDRESNFLIQRIESAREQLGLDD